jgi:hypothetical protein
MDHPDQQTPDSSALKQLIRACAVRDYARKQYAFFSKTRDARSSDAWYEKLREAEEACRTAQQAVRAW